MPNPSVHVVLLNWNGVADTLECLASLGEQHHPPARIHVVDNGSAEDEAGLIEREFAEVNVIRQSRNLGFCEGNNVGIRRALEEGADYVMLLNNDALAPPELISALLEESAPLKNVGAVSPVIVHHPEHEKLWFAGSAWDASTAGFRHLLAGRARAELETDAPFKSAYACGCCLLVHSSVLRRVGLMDNRYFAYYDEADWCSRMRAVGLDSYVIPKAVLYHKVSRSTPSLVTTYLLARNRLLWMDDYLTLRERSRSFSYLMKEFFWNAVNATGFRTETHALTKAQSKAILRATRDYFFGNFGAWPKRIEVLMNSEDKQSFFNPQSNSKGTGFLADE